MAPAHARLAFINDKEILPLKKNSMKQTTLFSFVAFSAILLLSSACSQARKGASASPSGAGKTIELFNGKDLSGWVNYGREKWYVENGELVCESGPHKEYGYLGSEKKFRNFDLSLEFKQEANGNSGVFFRSSIEGVKISGWQSEVAPKGSHTGGIYESYGRGWLIQPTDGLDEALKENDWNTMRIRCVEGEVTTWLNGTQMITLKDEKIGQAPAGMIALQIHDGGGIKVRWRNLRIQSLD
jgi:hypothetical protein